MNIFIYIATIVIIMGITTIQLKKETHSKLKLAKIELSALLKREVTLNETVDYLLEIDKNTNQTIKDLCIHKMRA